MGRNERQISRRDCTCEDEGSRAEQQQTEMEKDKAREPIWPFSKCNMRMSVNTHSNCNAVKERD